MKQSFFEVFKSNLKLVGWAFLSLVIFFTFMGGIALAAVFLGEKYGVVVGAAFLIPTITIFSITVITLAQWWMEQ